MQRWLLSCLLSLAAAPVAAQDTTLLVPSKVSATLTFDEAMRIARRESPEYRQTLNNAGPAKMGVRNAYGNFIPSLSLGGGLSYTGSGSQFFGGTTFEQPSSYGSSYNASFSWLLDGRTIANVSAQKSLQRATTADIEGADMQLLFNVSDQYLQARAAEAQVDVARQQVRRNLDFLALAEARNRVGQATLLDVRQAQTTLGASEVVLLQAIQTSSATKLELFRLMGVSSTAPIQEVALTDSFPVAPLALPLAEVQRLAEENNPALRGFEEREGAAKASLRAARWEYLPSLRVNGGWSGFTNQFSNTDDQIAQAQSGAQGGLAACQDNNVIRTSVGLAPQDCTGFSSQLDPGTGELTPEARGAIVSANDVFPFNFTDNPFQVQLSISLPLFTGFSRSLRVSQAKADREDAEESVRAQRLFINSAVETRYLGVETAFRAIAIQGRNREAARDQLRLAQDRYRLGSGSALEVSDAQNVVQQAEGDYVNAIYGYHRAVASLEVAVGRRLR